ncbi:RNA exonuclease 1 homolog isoform X1 [Microplitis mediator]|uniref:RNA exonuclease 1 homolog isoform X1 n=1 Tax=Microplitis mediator TaxID=375433 RepID=UPI002557604A|nr:RNA exonuclease 1 homolog isoform X1 [Microplitis mediator]
MLPSTGYFKSITCPFYDNGSCDRPYCHFKHLRREDASSVSASVVSSLDSQSERNQKRGTSASTSTTISSSINSSSTNNLQLTNSITTTDSQTIQQLVTEAVTKVLADQNVSNKEQVSETIVSKVVEGLKPTLTSKTIGKHIGVPQLISKPPCVYNPTPISELKKRHIAVPVYMPTRESKVAVKRKTSDDGVKPWLSNLPDSIKTKPTEITYKPTAINTINALNDSNKDKLSDNCYVPTSKSQSTLNYDNHSNNYGSHKSKKEAYYPKPKKRREEYVPKMVKAPLKSLEQLNDCSIDEFEPEFNMLDEILISASSNTHQLNYNPMKSYYTIEPKFSDDENEDTGGDVNTGNKVNNSTKEVQKTPDKTICNDKKIVVNENDVKNNKLSSELDNELNIEDIDNNESRKNCDDKKVVNKTNDERSKERSSHSKSSSNSRSSSSRSKSSSSKSDNNKEKNDRKDDKKSTSSSDRHRSSSKRSDKSSSKDSKESKQSSSRSKDKSRSHRDREKSSSSKENDRHHHKSSRHDKHESSKSGDKKKSKSNSNSNSSNKSNDDTQNHKSSEVDKVIDIDSDNDVANNEFDHSGFINEDELMETSDSDHDVEEECLKIFQEYQESDHPKGVTTKNETKADHEAEAEEIGKKRVAHPLAASTVVRSHLPSQPLKRLPNPQQRMYERWKLMREATADKAVGKAARVPVAADKDLFGSSVAGEKSQVNGTNRIRIAPVSNVKSLEQAKKKVLESVAKVSAESKTVAQTRKGARVAHIPQVVPQLIRPEPLQVTTQKFPLNIRQYYVNLMHDICIQIYTSGEDAAQRALREELACHERCKALTVYKNSCMLAAHRLRKEVDQNSSTCGGDDDSMPSSSGIVSHDAVLAGKSKGSWSVVKSKKIITDFKGSALYNVLKKWIMTEQQLRDNGFPRPHPDKTKGRAKIYTINTRNQSIVSKVPNERYCSRCNKPYMVDKYGIAVQKENCIYHWGRKFTIRGEGKYSCCQQYGSASGCSDAKNHVWDKVDYENLRGYVQTLPKDIPTEKQKVYALDCEMSYTTQGLELTRVTVINDDCKTIYETLVKPDNPIIDYNTRFSGITEENMMGVTTTLLDVQATLLSMFSEKTILIGHSLESDFKALKLIHNTVVDTSTVFPHKNGYPQKRALKNLCSEYLRKIIQNDVGGHDSSEDAIACMELMQWKVKEEAKLQ